MSDAKAAQRNVTDPNRFVLDALNQAAAAKREALEAEYVSARDAFIDVLLSDPVHHCTSVTATITRKPAWLVGFGSSALPEQIAVFKEGISLRANGTCGILLCVDGTLRCKSEIEFSSCTMEQSSRYSKVCVSTHHVIPLSNLTSESLTTLIANLQSLTNQLASSRRDQ